MAKKLTLEQEAKLFLLCTKYKDEHGEDPSSQQVNGYIRKILNEES